MSKIVLWSCFVLIAVFTIPNIIVYILEFIKLPKSDREREIREWLLQACILAEKEFGGGTGKLKLSYVYSNFCKVMPWIAQVTTFSRFSELVDEVLIDMRNLLNTNQDVAAVVEDL